MREARTETGIEDEVYWSREFTDGDIYNYSSSYVHDKYMWELSSRSDRLPDLGDERGNLYPRENVTDLYSSSTSDEYYVPDAANQGTDSTPWYHWNPSTQVLSTTNDYLCDSHYVRCDRTETDDNPAYDGFGTLCGKIKGSGSANYADDLDDDELWGNNQCYSLVSVVRTGVDNFITSLRPTPTPMRLTPRRSLTWQLFWQSSFGTLDSCANANLREQGPYGPEMCLQNYATVASQTTYQGLSVG